MHYGCNSCLYWTSEYNRHLVFCRLQYCEAIFLQTSTNHEIIKRNGVNECKKFVHFGSLMFDNFILEWRGRSGGGEGGGGGVGVPITVQKQTVFSTTKPSSIFNWHLYSHLNHKTIFNWHLYSHLYFAGYQVTWWLWPFSLKVCLQLYWRVGWKCGMQHYLSPGQIDLLQTMFSSNFTLTWLVLWWWIFSTTKSENPNKKKKKQKYTITMISWECCKIQKKSILLPAVVTKY